MLHLVARVEDPYSRRSSGRPPLAVGLFVDAEIAGQTVVGTVLPRSALRSESRVLVVDGDDRLRWRGVDAKRIDDDAILISDGLQEGEKVCVSPLDIVVDGMQVRTPETEAPSIKGLALTSPMEHAPIAETEATEPTVEALAQAPTGVAPEGEMDQHSATPGAAPQGHLVEVSLLAGSAGSAGSAAMAAAIGGDFSYATSRLQAPERFVLDLIGVVKANPRAEIQLAEGPVERVRIAQFQSAPEPITRIVFDLQSLDPDALHPSPEVERTDQGLTITF